MTDKTLQQTFRNLKNMKLSSNDKLCVGLSGGADSVFLLHSLVEYNKTQKHKPSIEAIYFDHGNNDISINTHLDVSLCQSICDSLNVKLNIINLSLQKTNVGYEAEARMLRIKHYQALIDDNVYTRILLGHHQDDHVETIFYQILRGMGTGASGIKSEEKHFLRPLLNINKEDIIKSLKERNIAFINDETNNNNQFTRNFLRNKLFPTLKEHWHDYKERLIFVGKKIEEQTYLLECLAKQDSSINGELIEINTTDKKRIKNAFKYILKTKQITSKDSVLEEIVKIIAMQKNNVLVNFENFSIHKQKANNGKIAFKIEKNNAIKPTPINCKKNTI